MKHKTIYLLAIICCLGYFSSAKQRGNICSDNCLCPSAKLKGAKQTKPLKETTGLEFSSFNIFFSI